MMWYALCKGRDLRACFSCRRLAEQHPEVQRRNQTSWLEPYVTNGQCVDWLAIPPPAPRTSATEPQA